MTKGQHLRIAEKITAVETASKQEGIALCQMSDDLPQFRAATGTAIEGLLDAISAATAAVR
jgi:hypothetical protein